MDISLNSFHYAASVVREKIHTSFTAQQKKIILVALLAFSCLTAAYLIYRFCFTTQTIKGEEMKKLDIHVEDLSVKELKLLNAILSDSPKMQ